MSADLQRRVLVVETVPRGTEELRRALSGEGYYVALAAGAMEAMRIVGTGSPDAVIVDLPPCEETAKAVTRRLREKQTQHLPLLALSPRDSVRDSVAGLDAGADDYLVHPFALDEFLARVSALLRRSDATDGSASLRRPDAGSRITGCRPRRPCDRSHAHRVRPAGAPAQEPGSCDPPDGDLQPRLGIRLRAVVQLAKRLCRVLASKDGSGG